MSNLQELKEQFNDSLQASFDFNEIAGKDQDYTYGAIASQVDLIKEEYKELQEALDNNDVVEVLDAVCDLYVVLNGLTQKLMNAGVEVPNAMRVVDDNNFSKFPVEPWEAEQSKQWYKETKGVDIQISYNRKYCVHVLKDSNSKVRKPQSYKDVELNSFVPVELLNGFPLKQ